MNLSTKTLLSTVLCFGLAFSALAQGKKNISKINLLGGPLFRIYGVSQEFKLSDRLSIQTMAKVMPPIKTTKVPTGGTHDGTGYNPFTSAKLFSVGNVTEFRIYGKEKQAFRGVYWGPYFTYNYFKFQTASFRGEFEDKKTNTFHSADVVQYMKLSNISGGLQVGVQGVIKNLVVIDWTILGLSFGNVKLAGGIEASNPSSGFDFNNYEDDIKAASLGLEEFQFLDLQKTVEPTKVEFGFKVPCLFFRTNLAIGINY